MMISGFLPPDFSRFGAVASFVFGSMKPSCCSVCMPPGQDMLP